ncbi:hypothetical protein WEI85_38705 [Actinomycetes bacterium KLBMP 9797]
MPEPRPASPADPEQGKVPDAVRVQILATEHWSLLAARANAWNESFSRASWFLTAVSATVVALALAADATDFSADFHVFALLLLPVLVLVGAATFARLMDLNREDVDLVVGMNRLRHGYLDLAPELEPYFSTGHHDDRAGIMRTYGTGRMVRIPAAQYLSSTALLVGAVDAVLVGALAGIACAALGAGLAVDIIVGAVAAVGTLVALFLVVVRQAKRAWNASPRFPS